MAGARVRDITLSAAVFGGGVSLDLPLHKTAQGGQKELTRRSLRFGASAQRRFTPCARLCGLTPPARLNFGAARGPDSALFPTTTTELRTKAASVEMFGLVLGTAGVETHHTTPDGQSARVAGATFLAARGVAVAVIQLPFLSGVTVADVKHKAVAGSEDVAKAVMVHLFTEAQPGMLPAPAAPPRQHHRRPPAQALRTVVGAGPGLRGEDR